MRSCEPASGEVLKHGFLFGWLHEPLEIRAVHAYAGDGPRVLTAAWVPLSCR